MEQTSKLKPILFWNLGIYLFLTLFEIISITLLSDPSDGNYLGMFFILFSAMSVGLQIGINFSLAAFHFIKNNQDLGKSFLISALVILLIGFPLCFGGVLLN